MALENSALWQVQSEASSGSETTAGSTNRILFNPSPILTTGGYIFNTEFNIRNSVPENEAVVVNNNEVQDMGLDGIDIQITGTFLPADTNADIAKFIKWMKDDKNGSLVIGYEEGRFGLRLDDFPHFNVVPNGNGVAGNNTFGYVLSNVRFVKTGNELNRVGFVATLRLSGDLDNAI